MFTLPSLARDSGTNAVSLVAQIDTKRASTTSQMFSAKSFSTMNPAAVLFLRGKNVKKPG
jgi:hypothetical protein